MKRTKRLAFGGFNAPTGGLGAVGGLGATAPAFGVTQMPTGIGAAAANRVAPQLRGGKPQFEKIGGGRDRDSRMLQNFGKNTLPPGIDQNIPTLTPQPQVFPQRPQVAPPIQDLSSIPGFTDWQNKNQQLQQLQQNFMQQNYGTQIAKMQDYGRQIQQLQPNSPEANRLIQEADQYSRQYLPQMTQQMQTQFGDQMQELGKLQASMQPAMQQWQQQWQPQVQQQQPTAGSGLAGWGTPQQSTTGTGLAGFGAPQGVMYKKGGKVKKMAKGGVAKKSAPKASSASKRGDGIAQRGKTKGRIV